MKFIKVFERDGNEIVVFTSEDDSGYTIQVTVFNKDGSRLDFSPGWETEEERDEQFNDANIEKLVTMACQIMKGAFDE